MRRILGIETSCDETSAAVVIGTPDAATLASCVILSQDVHRLFGGVVPEIASRQHLTGIVPAVDEALRAADTSLEQLDAIAVTHAPGLVGALLVGTSFAKGLAFTHDLPLVPVHHLEGHLFATLLEHADARPPFTALLVSGGHTLLLDVPAWGRYRVLGRTRDDAVGEAFDKVAKLLGLPYPGGRPLEQLAATADSPAHGHAHHFARPMLRRKAQPGDDDYYDCSFSGLKTAVLLAVRAAEQAGQLDAARASIARGFQDAVIETLVEKVWRALRAHGRERVVLGGGVACNNALQQALAARLTPRGATLFAPSPRLATDNAAMIAAAGLFRLAQGDVAPPTLTATASLPLPGIF
ncbi:MAG: tRNA (adenosine(37)-N6)-threonylcarbamoyltransferase complex transferase subunit TsaD [Gemmatimonadetes bacterium]|nr:tRNA (adenosine(37)-N6)-threonylcarbamoyltransferase complex transferase subunit TsaD [Gemmatimonadota bacterium]